jgi:hypothetical protein
MQIELLQTFSMPVASILAEFIKNPQSKEIVADCIDIYDTTNSRAEILELAKKYEIDDAYTKFIHILLTVANGKDQLQTLFGLQILFNATVES